MTKNAKKQRGLSRSALRARNVEAALQVPVEDRYDLIVVGGGASGLAAAITAADQGLSVCVLERNPQCGQKILATGNGRCNFSNRHLSARHFSPQPFCSQVMGDQPEKAIQRFFRELGLHWTAEEGRLYPRSLKAQSVRNLLMAGSRRLEVTLAAARSCTSLKPPSGKPRLAHGDGLWEASYREEGGSETKRLRAAAVIGACCCDGLELFSPLGLDLVNTRPVLCALATKSHPFISASGCRIRGQVRLERQGETLAQDQGEIMFRDYGLSGIAIFNLSRHARPQDRIHLDFLPEFTHEQLEALLTSEADLGIDLLSSLEGLMDPQLAACLLKETRDLPRLIRLMKDSIFQVEGPCNTEAAQVTAGGVSTSTCDPDTLQVLGLPGLYLCGELLDVDADCGGYNLSWAWLSGMKAARSAVRYVRNTEC